MTKIKGSLWLSTRDFITETYGEEALGTVLRTLIPQEQELFANKILPVSWIPLDAHMHFIVMMDKVLGKGDFSLLKSAAIFSAHHTLSGLYKMFFSFLSPQQFLHSALKDRWRAFYSRGQVRLAWEKEKGMGIILSDFPDIQPAFEIILFTTAEELLRLTSAKNPRVTQTQCVLRGDPHCAIDFTWD